jgi:hypothetical protein
MKITMSLGYSITSISKELAIKNLDLRNIDLRRVSSLSNPEGRKMNKLLQKYIFYQNKR